jgi:predicted regulator of Ras-like GTPase activity (Roadblock/LC7/MglB family)
METERRVLRSETPGDALRIFLAKNATEPGLRAAVVASEDGLLIGGVGEGNLETLAAVGSAKAAGTYVGRYCAQEGLPEDSVFTRSVTTGDHTFVVASMGSPMGAADRVGALLGRLLA